MTYMIKKASCKAFITLKHVKTSKLFKSHDEKKSKYVFNIQNIRLPF